MPSGHDILFRTLADPTRRALFERLCRDGEQTVGALTAQSGVSQPAVSKHLGVLRRAGLVCDRHGAYDEAFDAYALSNRLLQADRNARGLVFDRKKFRDLVERQISTFDPKTFAEPK